MATAEKLTPTPMMIIVLVGIGLLLNMIPAPLESGGVIVFGFSAAILLALLSRPVIAIVATLIITLPLLRFDDSLLAILVLSLQPIVVALTYRDKTVFGPLVAGAIGWSLLAIPSLLFVYASQPLNSMIASVVVTWLSGVVAFIAGHLAYLGLSHFREHQQLREVRVESLFKYLFSSLFFLVIFVVTFIHVGLLQRQQADQIGLYMDQRSKVMNEELTRFISSHRKAIHIASQFISEASSADGIDIELGQSVLNSLGESYSDFLTFLIADRNGELQKSYPENLMAVSRQNGFLNISGRDYFQQAKANSNTYVSPAFRGRGFGNDPIMAISSPIFDQQGEFSGIIEGSLSLLDFKRFDYSNLTSFWSLIIDNEGKVIYSSEPLNINVLSHPEIPTCLDKSCRILTDFNGTKRFISIVNDEQFGWQVVLLFNYSQYVMMTADYLVSALIIMGVLTIGGILIGYFVARWLSEPMARLMANFSHFNPEKEALPGITDSDSLPIKEVNSLEREFHQLCERLVVAFGDLNQTQRKERALNQKLEELNATLSDRVKEKTASLANALKEAEAANVAKSQFLANMSHEIRTPMNGIIGSCENMLESELDTKTQRKISVVIQSASNLLLILDSILDWSKIEAGKMSVVNEPYFPTELFYGLYELHRHSAARKGIKLILELSDTIPKCVIGDQGKVNQVLNNLMNNAIKFTSEGSVTLAVYYEKESLLIQVTDTGIGISEDKIDRVFEQFEQADASTTRLFGGTGLGLAITSKLTELMRGTIMASSTVGKGSCFTITLPAPESEMIASQQDDRVAIPDNTKILLVEDNDINAEIVIDMLATENVKLLRVGNGKDALSALSQFSFDVILMDCQMPVMDGFAATREIRKMPDDKAYIPIIALTANAYNEDVEACVACGMNAHLSKPIRKLELFRAISKWTTVD